VKKYSFRQRQQLILFLLAVVSSTIFLVIFLRMSHSYITQQMTSRMNTVAELKINQVEQWLDQGREVAQLVSTSHSTIEHIPPPLYLQDEAYTTEEAKLLTEFRAIEAVYPYISSISLLSVDEGKIFFSSDPKLFNRVRKNEAYFLAGQQDVYMSQILYSVSSEAPILTISAPARDEEGKLLAVVVVEMALEDLAATINRSIGLGETGKVYLVDAYGFYITLPTNIQGNPLSTIAKSEGIRHALSGLNGTDIYANPQGLKVLGSYHWLPGPGLGLLVEIEEAELYQQIERAWSGIIILILSILMLSLGASYWLIKWLVAPLEKIAEVAGAIQTGDYDMRAEVEGPDEIIQLSVTFNEMADSVQLSHDKLEQLVDERTHELRESEEKIRSISENSSDLIILVEQDLKIKFINRSIRGLKTEDMIGTSVIDLAPNDFRKDTKDQFQKVFRTGKTTNFQSESQTGEGEIQYFDVRLSPIILDGKPVSVISSSSDITERMRAEEEKRQMEIHLRQGQKLESIGTLASGVAHEINNPIMGAMNYAQLISQRLEPEQKQLREYAGEIRYETERVAEIVRNLLAFAREEKKTHSPARMDDILNRTLTLIRTVIKRDQIRLEVDLPDDLPTIKCRSQQIQQVLMNLLTNARDALNARYPEYDPDKIVTVMVRSFEKDGQGWLRTTVEDHGVGIPAEIRERIFDPFYTSKDRALSTGLGLSISLGIIQDHHGKLTFESEEGKGTRFFLDLPVDNGWNSED
jgi:PAS domain S-box-containing protein